jgi:hypothetical protein
MADAESIKGRLKEERIPKALWPRIGKIKHIFSAASPVPPAPVPWAAAGSGGCGEVGPAVGVRL